ncbi:HAD-IA family hydrolase [Bosea sp. 117]|uniref:HAD family hydrolase n=1 Tax=Bosea sp. 117 TaxID=1125973 RepID=UPI0004941177|nr:HAD-IA family hydrolase [Bosea sp. 117]
MNALRALLFDKDGTLVDFDRTWGPAAGEVIRRICRGDVQAQRRLDLACHYLREERRFLPTSPLLAGSSAQYAPIWGEVLGRPVDGELLAEIDLLFLEEGRRFLTPIGRPAQTLARLHASGLRLGMATNDVEANGRLQAELLGITPFLDAIYGYDSGHGPKPSPGMVEAFARQTGFAPGEIGLVGDTDHDLACARAAGARAILVRTGVAPIDHLIDEADLVVDDVEALARLVIDAEHTEAVP